MKTLACLVIAAVTVSFITEISAVVVALAWAVWCACLLAVVALPVVVFVVWCAS